MKELIEQTSIIFILVALMLTVVFDQVGAQQQKQHNTTTLLTPPDLLPSSSPSLTDLFKHVENSVVQITSIKSNPDELVIINGNPITGQSTALGSGFVYDIQGHIITNYHVIAGASRVEATFIDGNTYPVKVIGKDPYSDLSILQITDNFSKEKIFPVVLGNSSRLQVGEQVISIGNPFGLSGTMTTGIVSQFGRSLPSPVGGYLIPNGIQTDAAINPGNSGGPLLNVQGEVIGMNTAIISNTGAYSGIGFAIPSNTITREVPTLIKTGTYAHPWLGLSGGKVTPALAKSAGLPQNYKGVLVASVQAASPAEKVGLRGLAQNDSGISHLGDIIIAIDGLPLRQIDDIINYIELHKNVGDTVKLTVNRNGKIIELTATLQARPTPSSQLTASPPPLGLGPMPEIPQIPGLP